MIRCDKQGIHDLYLQMARLDRYVARQPSYIDSFHALHVWRELEHVQKEALRLRISLLEDEHVDYLCGDGKDHPDLESRQLLKPAANRSDYRRASSGEKPKEAHVYLYAK